MSEAFLTIGNLTLSRGGRPVLSGFTVSVPRGEIFAFGPRVFRAENR